MRGTLRCARVKGLTMAVRLARIGASPPANEAGPTVPAYWTLTMADTELFP
jgi:hypothetical protein